MILQSVYVRSVLDSYFVNLDNLENLSIRRRTLKTLLENMGLINALIIRENVYPNLVTMFYSNMDITESRILNDVLSPDRLLNKRGIVQPQADRLIAEAYEDPVQQLLCEVLSMSRKQNQLYMQFEAFQ